MTGERIVQVLFGVAAVALTAPWMGVWALLWLGVSGLLVAAGGVR